VPGMWRHLGPAATFAVGSGGNGSRMQTQVVLAERYMLLDQLGQGGMSVVWRAQDLLLDRPVAVKMLAPSGVELIGEDLRAEALSAARVVHPNVASVFDYGEVEFEPGRPTAFIVMELLAGTRLSQNTMPMAPLPAIRVCAEVAAALAAAHAQGVVHRDVKPGNVMLTPEGVKVFDFGIAARIGALEADDSPVGTPTYLAPERLTGDTVTAATDVYALGVMLHRLLTGTYPLPTSTIEAIVAAHVSGEPTRLPPIVGMPDGIADLCLQCLAKDPLLRPTARDVAIALADAVGIPIHLGDDAPNHAGSEGAPSPTRPRRGVLLAVGGVAAVAVLAGAALATPIIVNPPPSAGAATPYRESNLARPTSTSTPVESTPPVTSTTPTTTPATARGVASGPAAETEPSAQPTPSQTTSSSPPTSPSTGPAMSEAATFVSAAGEVVARCYGPEAFMLSWLPYSPYRVDSVNDGPGTTAWVTFRHGQDFTVMTVSCPGASPVVSIVES
jgi:eukaryotic-like serine/threonine-protein kinase